MRTLWACFSSKYNKIKYDFAVLQLVTTHEIYARIPGKLNFTIVITSLVRLCANTQKPKTDRRTTSMRKNWIKIQLNNKTS